jgi:hypothetical protein
MVKEQFDKDLVKGKRAERIVYNYLKKNFSKYIIQDVSDIPYFYSLGDIRVITTEGEKHLIEVKNDECIANTHNILCEFEVDYETHRAPGNFLNEYEFYAVVSESESLIYFFDFKKLKALTKYLTPRLIQRSGQSSICKFVALSEAKRNGSLIATVNYGG